MDADEPQVHRYLFSYDVVRKPLPYVSMCLIFRKHHLRLRQSAEPPPPAEDREQLASF